MSSYDDRSGRRYDPRDAPRDARYADARYADTRYADARETYRASPSGQELVPRSRNDNELMVEQYEYERDVRRSRSAEPYYDDYYDRYDHRSGDHHRSGKGAKHSHDSQERSRRRVISKEQKIMAALAGAALFAGGKELYDRHEAKEDGTEIRRNPLASAALGAAGALAGYQGLEMYEKHAKPSKSKQLVRTRDGRVVEDYWDSDDSDSERYHEKGHKNFLEKAIAAAGLGSALKAANNRDDRSERSERSHRTRSRRGSRSSSRSSRRSESGAHKVQQAAMASLLAGASEAFRVSKQPGSWKGEKTKRVLTAAISAGGIDAAQDTSKHGKTALLESVLGGLLANRAIRGSKKDIEEDRKTGRSRSRSRARSAHGGGASIAGPLAAIAGALAAKKAVDHSRSGSRGRHRDDSADSHASRHSRRGIRERSRSAVRKGLAKIGIGNDSDHYDDGVYEEDRRHHRHRGHDDEYRSRSRSATREQERRYESDSDSGNTDEEKKQYRKMKGKLVLTTGLATVATIHAARSMVGSYGNMKKRRRTVRDNQLDPKEAKKLKGKALVQDAAAVGLAVLGVHGAISDMKEAKEMNKQRRHWKEEKQSRHERRLARQKQLKGPEYRPRRRADGYHTTSPARSRRYDDDYGDEVR